MTEKINAKNGAPITVAKAEASDAAFICAICNAELGYECAASLVEAKIKKLDGSREAVFVARADGTAIGFVHVEKYDTLYFETMANILGLAVGRDFQRNGAGKALVRAAEEWAARNGIRLMRVNSGIARTAAHAFHRRLGYSSEKKQLRFMKEI